jgi:hypothetical protein
LSNGQIKKIDGEAHKIMHATSTHQGRPWASLNAKYVAHCAFMLLFPGFFFYQTLLGLGIIGAFLGGYFTLVAIILTLPLVFFYSISAKKGNHHLSKLDIYCLVWVTYFLLALAINFAAGANEIIVQRYIQVLIFCIDNYVIFRMIDLGDRKFIALATISLVFMSVITVYFSIDGFFFLQALDATKDPDSLATYQGFARSYIYTYLIVICVTKTIGMRFLLYVMATFALFLNGARSEFVAVLLSIPMIELYYIRRKLILVSCVAFLLALFGMNVDAIVGMLPDNRTLQLLDLSHSSSAVARQHLASDAWRTIAENPILGGFASYPDGHYAHNILSAWVDFGLVGFLGFAGLLIAPEFYLFFNGFFSREKSREFILAFSFLSIVILWELTAKEFFDMSVGAALGAFAKHQYGKRYG